MELPNPVPSITINDLDLSSPLYDDSTSSARSTGESSTRHEDQESSFGDEDEDVMDEQHELDPDEEHEYASLGTLMRKCGYRLCDKQNVSWFWPDELRKRVLTRGRIMKELQGYQEYDHTFFGGKAVDALADTILSSHHRIFAILTLIDKGSHIVNVIEDGVADKDLPLRISGVWDLYRVTDKATKRKKTKCSFHVSWGTNDRESFCKYQPFLAPAYLCFEADNRTLKHLNFDVDTILPFTHKEQGQQGGFGSITKVKIHPKCHGFHGLLRSVSSTDFIFITELIVLNVGDRSKRTTTSH
jgi:hypothetical protein